MILGMSIPAFTLLHVRMSLVGIRLRTRRDVGPPQSETAGQLDRGILGHQPLLQHIRISC